MQSTKLNISTSSVSLQFSYSKLAPKWPFWCEPPFQSAISKFWAKKWFSELSHWIKVSKINYAFWVEPWLSWSLESNKHFQTHATVVFGNVNRLWVRCNSFNHSFYSLTHQFVWPPCKIRFGNKFFVENETGDLLASMQREVDYFVSLSLSWHCYSHHIPLLKFSDLFHSHSN